MDEKTQELLEEATEEMVEVVNAACSIIEQMTPRLAELYKNMYDDLLEAGFTEEGAMRLIESGTIEEAIKEVAENEVVPRRN